MGRVEKHTISDSSRLSFEQLLLGSLTQCRDARNNDNPALYKITVETLALLAKRNDAYHNDVTLKKTIGDYEKNILPSEDEIDQMVKDGTSMHDAIISTYDAFLTFILDEMEGAGLLAYKRMVRYGNEYD